MVGDVVCRELCLRATVIFRFGDFSKAGFAKQAP